MAVAYKDMTPEQKAKHYISTEKYRKKNMQQSRDAALKYYYADKERAANKAKDWRSKNKEYIKTKQREDKRKRKLWAIEYLGGVCQECKQTHHPAVYEFHHINPTTKDRDPSKMLSLSLQRLTDELNKCLLLCANCHRLIHHKDSY